MEEKRRSLKIKSITFEANDEILDEKNSNLVRLVNKDGKILWQGSELLYDMLVEEERIKMIEFVKAGLIF